MEFVTCIKKIVKKFGKEKIAQHSFMGLLADYNAFEDEAPSSRLVLKHWSENGILGKISRMSFSDSRWKIEVSDIIHQTETEGFQREVASNLLHKLLLGMGVVGSSFDWNKEFLPREVSKTDLPASRLMIKVPQEKLPMVQSILSYWKGNGIMSKILNISTSEHLKKEVLGIIQQTKAKGFDESIASEMIRQVLVGKGIVSSSFDWDRELLLKRSQNDETDTNTNKNSSTTATTSSQTRDIPLAWIGNGDDCSQRGTLYLDTELPVSSKSIVLIKFNAAKWDGPIAGFRNTGERLTIDGIQYREVKWSLRMHNNKLEFNYPIEQQKPVDLGTFLPHHDYIVQTCNCIPFICKSDNSNIVDTVRGLRSFFKARGLQRGPKDMMFDYTIKLFKIQNCAWQGLKIMYFKMTEGNVTIADMRPVLHNGHPCMYDSVRKEYFYFSGNGNPSYQCV